MDINAMVITAQATLTHVGLQVLGALILYLVGRWLINVAIRVMQRTLTQQHFEPTLLRFLGNTISVVLNITLIIAILGYFGVQTTSFAALLAGAGLAIGTAWGGLLSNFAAGVFLVVLRPFKVGDVITAGGVTGAVEEVGLFVTTINNGENIRTFVGNSKIFADNIQNYSANSFRRMDLPVQLPGTADVARAIAAVRDKVSQVPNVLSNPPLDIGIQTFTPAGPVLSVKICCNNAHYGQVLFDSNNAIREVLISGEFPAPIPTYAIRQLPN